MKHAALILLSSLAFTACMTETDKVLWTETKDVFSSDGVIVPSAVAELKAEAKKSDVAEKEKDKEQKAPEDESVVAPKPSEATTGR